MILIEIIIIDKIKKSPKEDAIIYSYWHLL